MAHCLRKIDIGFLQTTPDFWVGTATLDKIPSSCSLLLQSCQKSPAFKNDTLQDFSEIFTAITSTARHDKNLQFLFWLHLCRRKGSTCAWMTRITFCDGGEKAYSTRQKHENDLLNKMQKYRTTKNWHSILTIFWCLTNFGFSSFWSSEG